jgi:hypothetical protein
MTTLKTFVFASLLLTSVGASADPDLTLDTSETVAAPEVDSSQSATPPPHVRHDYAAAECPVIGNTETGIFYMDGQSHYKRMLVENECVGLHHGGCNDNRKCFKSRKEAAQTVFVTRPTGKKINWRMSNAPFLPITKKPAE